MGFIKKLNQDFFIENNQIILSKEYLKNNKWRFKKITGSRIASVLNKNKYSSPLKTWCIIVGIYVEEMEPFFMEVGNIIEPKILKYANEKMQLEFMNYDPKLIQWDVFKNDKIFGGIPDGEPINDDGQFEYPKKPMLEIKTTSIDSFQYEKKGNNFLLKKDENGMPIVKQVNGNLEKWYLNGQLTLPDQYIFQLSLYLFLRKTNLGVFFVCFLETKDYINPSSFDPTHAKIEAIEMEINPDQFRDYIQEAKTWYEDYVLKGKSPIFSNEDEQFLLEIDNAEHN